VEWIGAELKFARDEQGKIIAVVVTITEDKAKKMQETIKMILAEGSLIHRKGLRAFAGLCSWVSSVTPVLRPFCQMLWAAITAPPAGRESSDLVSRARVKRPLEWIQEFTARNMVSLPRSFPVRCRGAGPVLGFDASTTGGGAWLALSSSEQPSQYMTTAWNAEDEKLLGATRGDPASQAVWETYALLLAVDAWASVLTDHSGTLEFRGDAQGILQAVLKRRARSPVINLLIAELQLCLGRTMFDMYASHVWSEDNELADDLSRLGEGAVLPASFADIDQTIIIRHSWKFLSQSSVHAAVRARAE
jgi:hypothetical protein